MFLSSNMVGVHPVYRAETNTVPVRDYIWRRGKYIWFEKNPSAECTNEAGHWQLSPSRVCSQVSCLKPASALVHWGQVHQSGSMKLASQHWRGYSPLVISILLLEWKASEGLRWPPSFLCWWSFENGAACQRVNKTSYTLRGSSHQWEICCSFYPND